MALEATPNSFILVEEREITFSLLNKSKKALIITARGDDEFQNLSLINFTLFPGKEETKTVQFHTNFVPNFYRTYVIKLEGVKDGEQKRLSLFHKPKKMFCMEVIKVKYTRPGCFSAEETIATKSSGNEDKTEKEDMTEKRSFFGNIFHRVSHHFHSSHDPNVPKTQELRYFTNHSKDAVTLYKFVSIDAEHRRWNIRFLPYKQPYNVGVYRLVVGFPVQYPFRPQMLHFLTKIYHPNVGEKDNIEIGLCNVETWKPTIRMQHLCDLISSMLNYPQPTNAVRKDIAEQMIKNRDAFYKEAIINIAKNHSEIRA